MAPDHGSRQVVREHTRCGSAPVKPRKALSVLEINGTAELLETPSWYLLTAWPDIVWWWLEWVG